MALPASSLAVSSTIVESTMVHSVTLYGPGTATRGDLGVPTRGEESEHGPLRARVRPESATERLRGDQPTDAERIVVRIRRDEAPLGIAGTWRLVWHTTTTAGTPLPADTGGDVSYSLVGPPVNDHGRGRYLDLVAAREVSP